MKLALGVYVGTTCRAFSCANFISSVNLWVGIANIARENNLGMFQRCCLYLVLVNGFSLEIRFVLLVQLLMSVLQIISMMK